MGWQLVKIILVGLGAHVASLGATPIDAVYALERQLERVVIYSGTGEIDGHDIALDRRDANIWAYGPDAKALLNAIGRLLCDSPLTVGGRVLLRFGAIDDPAAKTEIILNSVFCSTN